MLHDCPFDLLEAITAGTDNIIAAGGKPKCIMIPAECYHAMEAQHKDVHEIAGARVAITLREHIQTALIQNTFSGGVDARVLFCKQKGLPRNNYGLILAEKDAGSAGVKKNGRRNVSDVFRASIKYSI